MLTRLPKEMYAEIARFLGQDFPGKGFRKAAGAVQIKDVRQGATYLNGVLHSFNDQPAIQANDHQYWYRHGELHRDNGPAIIWTGMAQLWYSHGKRHRDDDLPAVIWADGNRYWYQHNMQHLDNGTAEIYDNGTVEYWVHGRYVDH